MTLVNDLWTHRGLVANLAQRELKARYKRSVLGWIWSLVNPASTLAIYAVVFGVLLKVQPPVAGNGHTKNFALYLFAGLVMWNFFNTTVMGSMTSLISAGPLLKKVFFPAECAPAANMLVGMSQAGIEAGILVVIMVAIRNASWPIVLVPFLVAAIALFSFGIGLALSVANVYLRDVAYLVGVLLNLLFYATPIVYPESLVHQHGPRWLQNLVLDNPMNQFVKSMRDVTYLERWPSVPTLANITASAIVMFLLGWFVFRRFGATVSEEL